jgi:hypothetical protein
MVTSALRAPAGIESVTPSASTSPPFDPTVLLLALGVEGESVLLSQPGAKETTLMSEVAMSPKTKREIPMLGIVGEPDPAVNDAGAYAKR